MESGGTVASDYRTRVVSSLSQLDASAWNALARQSADGALPAFLRHEFLDALERSGCVGEPSGWVPEFVVLESREPKSRGLRAAAPLYRKFHSWGEYVFDWAWADAYQRHGLRYYPKLVGAIPFTPVTGARLLASDEHARSALADAVLEHARGADVSSLHVLFPREREREALCARGMMGRESVQFHWHNRAYRDFDQFLASLAQPKRKKIRAERRKVRDASVSFERLEGGAIRQAHWDFFSHCYASTYAAHGSTPYLTSEFFLRIGASMPENLIMVLAHRAGRPIAASLLVRDRDRLYGRYWGTVEPQPMLHFETAYYQAIEIAIELGIAVIEGGAQGEHKMARGFVPERTGSAHWLAEPAFADAVQRFLEREGALVAHYADELRERAPFRGGR